MRNTTSVILLLCSFLLMACASSEPVHIYSGETRPANETARLIIPGPISLLSVDQNKVDTPSIENGNYEVVLLPGIHRIEFKYELFWGDGTSGLMVVSDKVAIETLFNTNMTYRLTYSEPRNENEAYEFAQDFQATLVETETGRKVASRSPEDFRTAGIQSTLLQADTPKNSVPQGSSGLTPPGMDAQTASREDAVKRLKFWWLIADEKEKQEFKTWLQNLPDTTTAAPK